MSVMIEEQETCINFSREDERAIIYTSDTTMMTKLNKLVELQDTEWKLEKVSKLGNGEVIGRTYSCPAGFVSFRSKRVKREYTEEERKQIAERLSRK
ncbi:hypothetical protein HNQ56_004389 [Anaerotaenia torta]|uniref:hypothetical protein n=1 Tax=Anaerotaenia torta TaxID=433293 RepID=UPI003D23CD14